MFISAFQFLILPGCDLRAVLHHQQPAKLALQGSILLVHLLPVPLQLCLFFFPALNGDSLRAGDPIPLLQHTPSSLVGPQVRLMGGHKFLPTALPVKEV